MSQAGALTSSSGPPPPTQEITFLNDQDTSSTTSGDVLNLISDESDLNNENGIFVLGSGNTSTIFLSNRISGTATTTTAGTANLVSLNLGSSPGTFVFDIRVCGVDTTTPAGSGYSIFATFYTNGSMATLVQDADRINQESPPVIGGLATMIASGNTAVVQVTGVAGETINWNCVGNYTQVN